MAEWRDLLTAEVLAGLERFTEAQEEREALPVAVNHILGDWLTGHGYLPYVEQPEGESDPDA